ncbi:hypothetical protein [Shimia sp. Alg240-R146]|uniref:hypothetical protein n=1 Tax=Shimia sp. Alg240-R146 TaxID=2993449 RepID=UPI0022E39FD7|nr:hypothetical protein [Shimia sp. Alg240-R146]
MHIVHQGFDTIALSIQANISQDLFDALDALRETAEENRAPAPFEYGGAEFDLLPMAAMDIVSFSEADHWTSHGSLKGPPRVTLGASVFQLAQFS